MGVSNSCTDNNTIAFCDIITVEFISQSHVASFPGPRRRRKGLISAVHAYAKLSIDFGWLQHFFTTPTYVSK